MSYLVIEDFRHGLDTRKSVLSARAGSLVTLTNCQITPGGEIEKRKAFVDMGSALSNTFGLQPTANDVVVFGSQDLAGTVNGTYLTIPIRYMRCQSPNSAHTTMTAVIGSACFNGKVYVVCKFTTGGSSGTYLFKENTAGTAGDVVADWTSGLVTGDTDTNGSGANKNDAIATAIKDLINAEGTYSAGTVTNSAFTLSGPYGSSYTIGKDITTTGTADISGTTAATGNGAEPKPGTAAFGEFAIVAGSSGASNKITKIEVLNASGGGAVTIIDDVSHQISWTTSNEYTAQLVADEINRFTHAAPEYIAVATGNIVRVYGPVTSGDDLNNYILKVTASGDVCIDQCKATFVTAIPTDIEIYIGTTKVYSKTLDGSPTYSSLSDLASRIASYIRTNHSASYNAYAVGSSVYFSRCVCRSDDVDLSIYVTLTGTGSGVTFDGVQSLVATANPLSAAKDPSFSGGLSAYAYSVEVAVTVTGGVGPYTYSWVKTYEGGSAFNPSGIVAVDPSNYKTRFRTQRWGTARYKCMVTDSTGTMAETAEVTITLSVI